KNKCVAEGTLVFDPSTGLTHRIEDIVDHGAGASVVAVDKAGTVHTSPITARFDQGEQDVIGLRLRDGTVLRVTPDHKVLTDLGWREAGALAVGDRVARVHHAGGFGTARPVTPEQARLLGYLIGDGYVGGKTPVQFINVADSLQADAAAIASSLGCDAHPRGIEVSFSHRTGEKNGVLELVRWAGIWGHLAPNKRIPAAFFDADISEELVANLVFGLLETDGWVSREQTGGLRVGYATSSEQLAHQLHWLLLRWGISSSVRAYDPTSQRASIVKGRRVQSKLHMWEVRVSGINNVTRFAEVIPMWGPRGQVLAAALSDPALKKHRGSQDIYLSASQTEPVLAYLRGIGLTASAAAQMIGPRSGDPRGGMRQVLGLSRLRRDHVKKLADALDSDFLNEVLSEDLYYARVVAITPPERARTFDVEVDELHTFVANGIVVHNCSAPFRQAEFDIVYGKGISREGSVLDVAVDLGIVKKSGAWYTYDGEQLGQGRENAKTFLAENPALMIEIYDRVRQQVGIVPPGIETTLGHGETETDPDDEPISLD
ncbi:MAG TPA: LAGLIDADG family homing endonuclease, partial [Acidimicrobiales bacterium]|nr:LAGLIDADG family homing endonuclease [Acidimicrobiales bacterium]